MYLRLSLLLSVCLVCILYSCQKNQLKTIPNDLQQFNLKGNVKSILEINYSTQGKYHNRIIFNEKGLITEQASYNPDGTLIRKWVNEYNRNNLKLSRFCYVKKDSLSYILRYYYNSQGKLIWTKLFDSSNYLISQYPTQYDDSFNITKETFLGEDATYKHLVVHSYNNQKKVKEDVFVDTIRKYSWKQIYQYNKLSQLDEIILKSDKDSLISIAKYTYLNNNKVDKISHFNAKMELQSITDYSYDRLNNIIEIIEHFPGNINDQIRSYQYSYDQYGNWTFLSESINHQPGNIITRKIEYYN